MEQTQFDGAKTNIRLERKCGFYELYIKRLIDVVCSVAAIVAFGWLYVIVAVLVRVKLGSPVLLSNPVLVRLIRKQGVRKYFICTNFALCQTNEMRMETFCQMKFDLESLARF